MANNNFNLKIGATKNIQTANDTLNASQNQYAGGEALLNSNANIVGEILPALISDDKPYTGLLELKTVPTGRNFTYTVARKGDIGLGTELKEGVTPSAESFSAGEVSGTMKQYGKIIYATDVSRDAYWMDAYAEQKAELPDSAARTQNKIIKEYLFHNAGLKALPTTQNLGDRNTRMSVNKTTSKISEITAEFGFSYWDLKAIKRTFVKAHAWDPSMGAIKVVMSQDAYDSLRQDPWFVSALHDNGIIDLWVNDGMQTMQYLNGFEFINAGADGKEFMKGEGVDLFGDPTNPDNIAAADLDATLIIAGNAGYRISQQGGFAGGFNVEYFEQGGSTKSDILNQRFIAGYKFMLGVVIHTSIRLAVYFSAKSTQTSVGAGVNGSMDVSWLWPTTETITENEVSENKIKDAATLEDYLKKRANKMVSSVSSTLSIDNSFKDIKFMTPNQGNPNGWNGKEPAQELSDDILKTYVGSAVDVYMKMNTTGNTTANENDGFVTIHFNVALPDDFASNSSVKPDPTPSDNSKVTIKSAVTTDGTTITLANDALVVAAKKSDFKLNGTDATVANVTGAKGATSITITLSKAIAKADKVTIDAYASTGVAVDTTAMTK